MVPCLLEDEFILVVEGLFGNGRCGSQGVVITLGDPSSIGREGWYRASERTLGLEKGSFIGTHRRCRSREIALADELAFFCSGRPWTIPLTWLVIEAV